MLRELTNEEWALVQGYRAGKSEVSPEPAKKEKLCGAPNPWPRGPINALCILPKGHDAELGHKCRTPALAEAVGLPSTYSWRDRCPKRSVILEDPTKATRCSLEAGHPPPCKYEEN